MITPSTISSTNVLQLSTPSGSVGAGGEDVQRTFPSSGQGRAGCRVRPDRDEHGAAALGRRNRVSTWGSRVYGSRQAQAMADTAALDLARYINYRRLSPTRRSRVSDATSTGSWPTVLTDNGSNAQLTVVPGYYNSTTKVFTADGYTGLGLSARRPAADSPPRLQRHRGDGQPVGAADLLRWLQHAAGTRRQHRDRIGVRLVDRDAEPHCGVLDRHVPRQPEQLPERRPQPPALSARFVGEPDCSGLSGSWSPPTSPWHS